MSYVLNSYLLTYLLTYFLVCTTRPPVTKNSYLSWSTLKVSINCVVWGDHFLHLFWPPLVHTSGVVLLRDVNCM